MNVRGERDGDKTIIPCFQYIILYLNENGQHRIRPFMTKGLINGFIKRQRISQYKIIEYGIIHDYTNDEWVKGTKYFCK